MLFRNFVFKGLEFIKYLLAAGCSGILLAGTALMNAAALPFEGEREYYLYAPSSQAEIKSELSLFELPFVEGESVTLENPSEITLEKILLRYGASVVSTEVFDGGECYYCYSPRLKGGIFLDGAFVNLHVAIGESRTIVGTPVIFGGY